MEIDKCLKIDTELYASDRWTEFTKSEEGIEEHSGLQHYHIRMKYSYDSLGISFAFKECVQYDRTYKMYLRIEGGAWQEVEVTPRFVKPLKHNPKLLTTAFTWSKIEYYRTLDVYRNLGFNQVPGPSYCYHSYESSEDYTTERRKEKYPGFTYCPENSLFYCSNSEKNLCSLYAEVLQ